MTAPPSRRAVLQMGVSVCTLGLTGCASIECAIDGNYDNLALQPVSTDTATSQTSTLLQYRNLSPEAQQAARKAIAKENHRQCHNFDGESGIESFKNHMITQFGGDDEWDTADSRNVYVKRGENYYGIQLAILDAEYVNTVPAERTPEEEQ